jgi:hypothetical protein
MEKSRKLRRSALVTLTITSGLAAAACCDRVTSPAERNRRSVWWRFWHNESWCGGYIHSSSYAYYSHFGGSRAGWAGATTRGGFGGAAHGFGGA